MHYRHGRKEQPAACRLEKTPGGCDLIKKQTNANQRQCTPQSGISASLFSMPNLVGCVRGGGGGSMVRVQCPHGAQAAPAPHGFHRPLSSVRAACAFRSTDVPSGLLLPEWLGWRSSGLYRVRRASRSGPHSLTGGFSAGPTRPPSSGFCGTLRLGMQWVQAFVCERGGGVWVWVQKFMYQKWPNHIFQMVRFVAFHDGHFDLWGGGGGPQHGPVAVSTLGSGRTCPTAAIAFRPSCQHLALPQCGS